MFSSSKKDEAQRNAKEKAYSLRNEAYKTVDQSRDDLRDAAQSAGRKVRSFLDNATEEFSDTTDKVTTRIKDKPVQSTLIALALGAFIGALLR